MNSHIEMLLAALADGPLPLDELLAASGIASEGECAWAVAAARRRGLVIVSNAPLGQDPIISRAPADLATVLTPEVVEQLANQNAAARSQRGRFFLERNAP